MRKHLFLFALLLLTFFGATAQEDEKMQPKGLLLENPVSALVSGYTTEQTILDVAFTSELPQWKKANWQLGAGAVSSRPYAGPRMILLESPAILLPVLQNAEQRINLYLDEKFQIESYHDQGWVQVSADNGKTWETVSISTGKSDWRTSVINLTSYAGKNIKLAFNLALDKSYHYEGWSIRHLSLKQEVLTASHTPSGTVAKGAAGPNARTMGTLNGAFPSVDAQRFPRYVFAQVKVSDGTTPLTNLAEPNFFVREYVRDVNGPGTGTLDTLATTRDESFKVYPPINDTVRKPVDIVFLMDNSGSMGDEQTQVANNVTTFVNQLAARGFNFRLGLCRFGQGANSGKPLFHNNAGWYTNAADFATMWRAVNTVDGGIEPSWDALYESSTQYSLSAASQKVFILITDESITGNNLPYSIIKDRQIVINKLLAAGIKTYTLVSPGANFDSDFGAIATATGGRSYNITAPFTDILNDIGTEINNTYTIRYTPTHPVFDGLVRDVEVSVNYNGSSLKLLNKYTPGAAPILLRTDRTLALHRQAQAEFSPVTIEVEAIDYDATYTSSVTLYYRTVGATTPYNQLVLSRTSPPTGQPARSIWSAVIPGPNVVRNGIQYYFRATDGVATTTTPEFIDRPGYPYSFAVLPNVAPVITHTPITSADPKAAITFSANVTDNTNSVAKVYLYYMKESDLTWTNVEMTLKAGTTSTYEYSLSALNTSTILTYYIVGVDNFGVSTFSGTDTAPYAIAVGVPWAPTPTTITQTIRFAASGPFKATVTIGNTPIAVGDVIAVFYNKNGQLKPAGNVTWTTAPLINITVYGDDPNTTTEKEGFSANETFTFKIFRKQDGKMLDCDFTVHTGSLPYFQANKQTYINLLKAYFDQTIVLAKGLNLWSTYLTPKSSTFADIFAPVAASVDNITDSYGNTYVPGSANNTLTTYVPGYGYRVAMKASATLVVKGALDASTRNVTLMDAGTIVGCPYPSKENVELVFPRMDQNIYIVDRYITDASGEVTVESYSPAWDINTWTDKNLEPGKGYYVYVFANQSFAFPAARGPFPGRLAPSATITQRITSLDTYMHVLVPAGAWNSAPDHRDEVRLYNKKGLLLGKAQANEEGTIVTLDGTLLTEGENFDIRFWDHTTQLEETKVVTKWNAGSDTYRNHRVAVIGSFQPTSSELARGVEVFPNPVANESKIVFRADGDQEVSIQLYNANGGSVMRSVAQQRYPGGKHEVTLNKQGLPKGLYLLKVSIGHSFETKQIVIE